jgi:SAM-dependent methyltransferase
MKTTDTPQITDNLLAMYDCRSSWPTRLNFRLFLWFTGLLGLPRNTRILDCGCATGHLLQLLNREGFTRLFGFDASPEMVEQARRLGVATIQHCDAITLSIHYEPMSMDVIIISCLLHHIPNDRGWARLFAACSTILAGQGLIIIREPFPNLPYRLLDAVHGVRLLQHGFLRPHLLGFDTEKEILAYFLPRWQQDRTRYLQQHQFSIERDFNWWVHRITTARHEPNAEVSGGER